MASKRKKRPKAKSEPARTLAEARTENPAGEVPPPVSPESPRRVRKRTHATVALALVVVTFLAYVPVFENDFVNYDDDHYITDNANVRLGLSGEGIVYAFTSSQGANWFPLTWLSWMLDYEIYGLNPRGFHLTSLLIHAASVVLLFLVFARMTGALWRSAFVAAVFAVHPLHVESVAWAAERKDVLSAFFWVLAMGAYARYVERPSTGRYVLVSVLLALGLMAKPMLVTLPFVLLLLDVWPLGRFMEAGRWRIDRLRVSRVALEKLPFLALAVASSIVTFIVQKAAGAVQPVGTYSISVRLMNALLAYLGYIKKAFWPMGLSAYYPHPGDSVSVGLALLSAFLLATVSALVVLALGKRPYLAVGWFWYLGTLVPVIGLVQVGQQAMADRYTYIPYIGLSIVLAWGAGGLCGQIRVPRLVPAAITLACLLGLAVGTSAQVGVWRSSGTLFEHALRATKDNPVANINLGVAYLNQDRLEEAETHLREAIRINAGAVEGHAALGALLSRKKMYGEALEHFRIALRLDPTSSQAHADLGEMLLDQGDIEQAAIQLREALNLKPANASALTNLGLALLQQGQLSEAIDHFRQAIALDPKHAEAYNNWGVALMKSGDSVGAVAQFREALAVRPDYMEAHYGLGLAAANLGDQEEAASQFREAVARAPDDAEIHYRLGLALANSGKAEESIPHLQEATALDPTYAEAHYSLGVTLSKLGRLDEAIGHFETALSLDPGNAESHYGLGLALAGRGDVEGAVSEYRKALALDPKFAAAHNSWGVVLAGQGGLSEAVTHFKKALSLDPNLADAHLNCGRALAQQGDSSEALSHFRAAVSLAPDDPDAHNNLGVFLAQQGDLERAVESFRQALRLQPDHRLAAKNLESTLAALRRRGGSSR